ncbi:c-type cytochrome [Sinimarinibacterium sp. NLF-5-8]|uniref:c-type cytochrome n=1 Tax=Sinimarinibacterium sp. NLF-5-8 TaxID=2698684 RepID=UPI00137BF488|nr:c-type cytochrome [Sinimarinibacterium sp. NLF-5-8]QHS11360.1 c-type cytochrome [Sinimarinibacterium sp. NLF-5-8]
MRFKSAARAALGVVLGALLFSPLQAAPDLTDHLRACAACHGEQGRSHEEAYYPSIAGKPAGYLYAQLTHFREGRREHAIMQSMLAYMSPQYLHDIAAYYAAQTPSHAARLSNAAPALLAQGEALARTGDPARKIPPCMACHAESLKGVAPDIPGLLGLPADYLRAQIGAWKTDTRRATAPDCMRRVAHALSTQQIAAVTAWIASQPYPDDHAPETSLAHALPMECGVAP